MTKLREEKNANINVKCLFIIPVAITVANLISLRDCPLSSD